MSDLSAKNLGRLMDRHAVALEFYAAQWTPSAADVVQEAFIELIARRTLPERIVPWLYRVVRNRAINAARSAKRRQKHEAAAANAEVAFAAPDGSLLDAEAVAEALRELPDDSREVVVARIWGELSFEEIAEVIGTSTSTAFRRYQAAIDELRERMGVTWLTKHDSQS